MLECVRTISRRGLGSQLVLCAGRPAPCSCKPRSPSWWLIVATICTGLSGPIPLSTWRCGTTFATCSSRLAKLATRHFSAKLEQNGRVETWYDVVWMPTQLSYNAHGRCCYKRTILSRAYALSWRRMIDQKEPETRSSQQITIDTYTRVHACVHASNTGITCYQHCNIYIIPCMLLHTASQQVG